MTERLYYDDAYLWEFDATVTGVRNGNRPGNGWLHWTGARFIRRAAASLLTRAP